MKRYLILTVLLVLVAVPSYGVGNCLQCVARECAWVPVGHLECEVGWTYCAAGGGFCAGGTSLEIEEPWLLAEFEFDDVQIQEPRPVREPEVLTASAAGEARREAKAVLR